MSVPVLIRLAPVVTLDNVQEQPPTAARRDLFESGALVPLHRRNTPVWIDHNEDREIGRVLEFYSANDAGGGRWHWARCELERVPGWLRVGSGASFEYRELHAADVGGWRRVYRAAISEVSILTPSTQPVEPRARVAWIGAPSSPATGARTSDRAMPVAGDAAEWQVYAARRQREGVLVRPGIGQVLRVR